MTGLLSPTVHHFFLESVFMVVVTPLSVAFVVNCYPCNMQCDNTKAFLVCKESHHLTIYGSSTVQKYRQFIKQMYINVVVHTY